MEILKEVAEKVVEVCKRRGIIFPSVEIYGSVAGFFEYGPVGTLLKRKFENYWREYFIKQEENIVEIDGCLILPDFVWEASGHLKSFVDPLTQCKNCKTTHRADNLIEEKTGKFVEGLSVEEMTKIIREEDLKCPKCGGELGDVKLFNLLSKTGIGPLEVEQASLRPETAQNIFVDFKRVFNAARAKLPFGIAQVGRSFRNEISPRQFIVRLREFNQCEIEMFLDPDKLDYCPKFDEVADIKITIYTREAQKSGGKTIEITASEAVENGIVPNKWMGYFMAKEFLWFQSLGIPREALRFRCMLEAETPHYSKGNFDLEIKFDFGWKESVGNAFRSDFDLTRHMKYSGEDLSVMTEDGRKIICQVVEPSFGIERPIAGILLHCF
ncbi:MAG: glycine--tRNA ligase, partial [Candidatus Aenigmarchaeota archaeon]|nr:glycine--tRNA ligase [Candidatus Aenigmarchaeota archaeon]